MDVIVSNLKDSSWWFTGIFFILVGLLLTAFLTKWLPKWYRKAATHVPSLLNQLARRRRLTMLRRIRSRRFHPLLVIREISRTDAIFVLTSVMGVLVLVGYSSVRQEELTTFKSLSRIIMFIPLYAFEILAVQRMKFLRELLRSCKTVGTTTICSVRAAARR